METVSNIASTVSRTIWGEQNTTQGNETAGKEPISGEQGKGTVTEPYDQGNSENPTSTSSTSQPEPTSDNPTSASTSEPTSKPEVMSSIPPNTENAAAGGAPNPLQDTEKTGVTSGMGQSTKGSDVIPSESTHPGVSPTSGGDLKQKEQGADRPGDAPSGHEEDAVKEKKDEAEDFLKTKDPNDHSGEPMKMHDVPKTQEERRDSKVGNPGGQEHGKEPKGTGQEWIKTTGMAADGGDFDATKAGAGREAERLLEEKGIKKTTSGTPATADTSSAASGEKEKVPLKEKVKAKLHIGHRDK